LIISKLQFSTLVDTFEEMEKTASRLALTDYLVSLLRKTPTDIIDRVVYLIQGKLHPDYEGVELGLAQKMAIRAISLAAGAEISTIEEVYRKTGDLGDTAAEIMRSKGQTTLLAEKITVERVYLTLDKIARSSGKGSQDAKLRLVSGLLSDATTTNEGSYTYGYWRGSLTRPQFAPGSNWNPEFDNNTCGLSPSSILDNPKGAVIPAVTNVTACKDGWFSGYKNWCINHAVDCVGNITMGYFPDMILKAHQEYLRGYNLANAHID
jgi:hypothetical protein